MQEIQTKKKYYNTNGQFWVDTKTNSFVHEKQFQKLVSLWPEKGSIIDIGCAGGIHTPLFLGIGRKLKYHGVDISAFFIKVAKRRYPQLNFTLADIADISTLPTKRYDGFFAASTLMHVPFPLWDSMFSNIEKMCRPGSFGYLTLPIAHPSAAKQDSDIRHFTILSANEQQDYLRERGWKIKSKGSLDGTTTAGVWQFYIVQLPG